GEAEDQEAGEDGRWCEEEDHRRGLRPGRPRAKKLVQVPVWLKRPGTAPALQPTLQPRQGPGKQRRQQHVAARLDRREPSRRQLHAHHRITAKTASTTMPVTKMYSR